MYCYYCKEAIGGREITRDHIIPKYRMDSKTRHILNSVGIKVTRPCCYRCNSLMEMAGECVGALSCAQSVAYHIIQGTDPVDLKYIPARSKGFNKLVRRILMEWRLMYGASNECECERPSSNKEPHPGHQDWWLRTTH